MQHRKKSALLQGKNMENTLNLYCIEEYLIPVNKLYMFEYLYFSLGLQEIIYIKCFLHFDLKKYDISFILNKILLNFIKRLRYSKMYNNFEYLNLSLQ